MGLGQQPRRNPGRRALPRRPVRKSMQINLTLVDALDEQLADVEGYLERTVKVENPQSYQLLRTIPGVTRTLSISIYDQVQELNYTAADRTALLLVAISFLALLLVYWRSLPRESGLV